MASAPSERWPSSSSTLPSSLTHSILNHPSFLDASQNVTNITVQNVYEPTAAPAIQQPEDVWRTGLHLLLDASDRTISLHSSARHPPPRCHKDLFLSEIKTLVDDAFELEAHSRLIFISGPAGVGKSANAQSLSEFLNKEGKLASAVFLPCHCLPDEQCHSKVLPTIAYHIAIGDAAFGQVLGTEIHRDPAPLTEAMPQQFHKLLVAPSKALAAQDREITKRVIIVDGIDHCKHMSLQREIIDLIVESLHQKSTPFLWVFFTREEPRIQSVFKAPGFSSLELTISQKLDPFISAFISDSLDQVGRRHGLATPWPSPEIVDTLVRKSAGFPLYASSLVQFIGSESSDPDEQLQTVLANAPWPPAEVDHRYTTFLRTLPPTILHKAKSIFLAISVLPCHGMDPNMVTHFLDISEREFRSVCQILLPILQVTDSDGGPEINFHHSAFMEFMQDVDRSGDLCLWSCAKALRQQLFERLIWAQVSAVIDHPVTAAAPTSATLDSISLDRFVSGDTYENFVSAFFRLCQEPVSLHDDGLLARLAEYPFVQICLLGEQTQLFTDMERFFQNIPMSYRPKIIRSLRGRKRLSADIDRINMPPDADLEHSYILGHGSGKVYCWGGVNRNHFVLVPCPKNRIIRYFRHLILCHAVT